MVPLTVSVKSGPPRGPVAGERLLIVGTGLLIVKFTDPDCPPPGVGLKTLMG